MEDKKQNTNPALIILKFFFLYLRKIKHISMASDVLAIVKSSQDPKIISWIKSFKIYSLIWVLIGLLLTTTLPVISYFSFTKIYNGMNIGKNTKINQLVKNPKLIQKAIISAKPILFVLAGNIALLGFLNFLISLDPLEKRNKKIKSHLEKVDDYSWLPIGVYFNITGTTLNNIVANEAMWVSLNMTVNKNFVNIHPNDKSKILVLSAFELKNEYAYPFKKK